MSTEIGFDAQAPSLPQGGGAVSGLGETFTPDLSTGTASFSIRLDCPNGPHDIGPRLSLRYDTAADNGPFGYGFDLPLPRLLRSTANGYPRYDSTDALLLEGAGELVALPDGTLRPQVDSGAWRAARSGNGFRLIDREGLYYYLGTDASARLTDATETGSPVYAWHLERIEDALGNAATFTWLRDGNQLYLSKVAYGAYELRFRYAGRPDVIRWCRCGFLITTSLRCESIELQLPSSPQPLLRRWTLTYAQAEPNGCSLLTAISLSGFDENSQRLDAPSLRLGYSSFQTRELTRFRNLDEGAAPGPLSRADRRVELLDWNGDGLPDLLEVSPGGRARVWPNLSNCTWGQPQMVADLPLFSSPAAAVTFADMNGDGIADLVRTDGLLDGYIPRVPADGFGHPVSWTQVPSVPASAPNARMVDLNGDGILDLLVTTRNALELYYRSDPDGWTPAPQVVSRSEAPDVDLTDPHVSLADMTGDGSSDVVRVDGGGVTYWPYLGHGKWDNPVRMANPPSLPFDVRSERLFVSDIDGDGCADVIYLDEGRLLYWINRSGNGFSDVRQIDYVPSGQITQARLADMKGSAAAGLLWAVSGPFGRDAAYYYLDFCGNVKPYLLNRIDNGVGSVTEIDYTTSAREAAADALLGQPWSTSLPVVIPVVATTTVMDAATGRVTTTAYHYHEGRYDGVLREFAGFGRVDEDQIGDAFAPTLRTTTWFHIGLNAAQPEERISPDERRHLRAIRGRIYRQERYGMDGSPQQALPYDRLEQQWTVNTSATPAVPIDVPRLVKTVRSNFERAPNAAAVIATLNTAWDDFGNVTDATQTSEIPGSPAQARVLRTRNSYAKDPAGRFLSRLWRVEQFDGAGALVTDSITEFDRAPEGFTGEQGLVTKKTALVLSDELAAEVYGATLPNFAALGYHRRAGANGWWVDQATYTRTDDASGLRGVVTGPRGGKTAFVFDANKTYPVGITDPCGNTLAAEYDYRACRVKRLVDATGATYSASFDALARPVAAVHPLDTAALPTVLYDYITDSLPVTARMHHRATSHAAATVDSRETFDGAGQLIERRVRDESGEIIERSHLYSSRNLLAKTYLERRAASPAYARPDDALPHVSFFYDALGRVIRQQNADGSIRTLTYGPLVIEEPDEEDNRSGGPHHNTPTRKRLDSTGRVQAIEQNLGGRILRSTYEYDVKGNLTSHVDALGTRVRIWYDFLGRTLRVDRPEHGTISVFDAAGNAVEARGAGVPLVFRDFDECNRPTAVYYTSRASVPVIRFTYHDAGRPAPADAGAHTAGGHCVRVDDAGGTTVFDYDERGRVAVKRSRPAGSAKSFELSFQHRSDGQLAAITYPDGGSGRKIVTYEHNVRGNISRISGVVDAIEYDLAGSRTRLRYANGVEQTFAYDSASKRLSAIQINGPAGVLRSTQYSWDLAGNLVGVNSPNAKVAASYLFDDLYRLTEASAGSGRTWSYRYDDAGNLTRKSDVGDYRYGENGAPVTCLTTAGAQKFAYTAMGEMRDTPWGTQTFDPMGRLTRIVGTGGKGQMDFLYDYSGVRVAARSSTDITPVVDVLTPDPLYAIESGVLVLNIFDGLGIAARIRDGGSPVYLHTDHLGGLAVLTNSAGHAIDELYYDPYGAVIERTGAGPVTPIGFTGGVPDVWSGLLYLQARYYHPGLGRFVSPDPIVQNIYDPVAWCPYAYCGNNPVTYVDPTGRGFWAIFLAAVAIVALVVLSVVTFGATTGLLVVAVGIIAGGVVGGLAAAAHGGSVDDILTGVFVGAAVGGWAAFASVFAGGAVASGLGLGTHSFLGAVTVGAVNGTINGAAIGFAAGFAGGKGSLDEILKKTLLGAAVGLVTGAILGGVAHYLADNPATKSPLEEIKSNLSPPQPQAPPPAATPPGAAPPGPLQADPALAHTVPEAAAKVGAGFAGKIGGPLAAYAARVALTGPLATAAITLTVDSAAGAWDLGYAPWILQKIGVVSYSGKF